MRLFIIIILGMLLSACGTQETKTEEPTQLASNDLISSSESQEDKFTLRLVSEKEQYKVGEPLNIVAKLTYHGEEDITIGHGGSWVALSTTNLSKGYNFGSAMDTPYISREIQSKQTIRKLYQFSGGTYHEGMGGTPFSEEEFLEMSKGKFPPGIYKIEAATDFVIEGNDKKYSLKGKVIFEVIE